ncbi:MAG TPA: Trm112 family protein [Candidatus Polarisedimenticolaceae bacterium]|nr:Trm112 family protein [Candidatus Polarisedimenticolaceae bacterium]
MTLDARLKEMLRCPACKGTLRLLPAEDGLVCDACARLYAIEDGIPDMIVENARPSR